MIKSTLLKLTKKRSSLLFLLLFFGFGCCFRILSEIQPKVEYQIQDRILTSKPSPFPPISPEEEKQEWAKEYRIAAHFASELDLYRAISTLKRAKILLPPESNRKMQLEYQILYCYYLGRQYENFLDEFDKSELRKVSSSFLPFQDLLLMLFDSYRILHKDKQKEKILEIIQQHSPPLTEKLLLSSALLEGNLSYLKEKNELKTFLSFYEREKKSSTKAELLNALLPGAGYFYLEQKRTAITALATNGLFLAATLEFFHRGFIAAGLITASFEVGWYVGGLYGAAEGEGKVFNRHRFNHIYLPG